MDVVFGPQILPENRVATHITNRTGVRHLHRRSPHIAEPDVPVELVVTTSGKEPFDEVRCRYRAGDLPPADLEFTPGKLVWDDICWDYIRHWIGRIPGLPPGTIVTYTVAARITGTSRWVYADSQTEEPGAATTFAYSVDRHTLPEWARAARVYHIFVDRFSPGAGSGWTGTTDLRAVHGGTLRGVIDHLDYIAGLGFNTIWLSPIFPSPTHHGYDPTDLFQVEPRLGTEQDFEDLIRQSHSRGIRVLLDFVPNHWSDRHPTFIHAREHEDSPFRSWYHWDEWPEGFRSYYDVRTMPKVNLTAGSPARDHMLEAARFWLRKGAAGYRVDHAEGPPADFWPAFRRACLDARRDAWLFGEVGRSPDVVRTYAGEFHGNLDFSLARALRQTFALGNWPLSEFEAFLDGHLGYYPAEFLGPAFLDNHDMNRFLFVAGGDERRLRLAALVLFTLPGPPIVYYGTERGLSQPHANDDGVGSDEARVPVNWEDDSSTDLQAYFARLNDLRSQYPIGEAAVRKVEILDDVRGLYAYSWNSGGGEFLVILNASDAVQAVEIPGFAGDQPADLLGDLPVAARDGRLEIVLAPRSGAFITGKNHMINPVNTL